MKISKKRLLHILDVLEIEGIDYLAHAIKKDWYPEVFREKMDGWYRDTREEFSKVLVFFEDDKPLYGFNASGTYRHVGTITMGEEHRKFMVPATHGAIKYHLCVGAVNKGFEEGGTEYHFNSLIRGHAVRTQYGDSQEERRFTLSESGDLYLGGCVIFHKGIWAEVIDTISKEEAEKQLGKKIV